LSGNPKTQQIICHGLPRDVRLAPFTVSPLCCRRRRWKSTVKPMYVRLLDASERSK